MEVDQDLPSHSKYWLRSTERNDCFFVLGRESEQTERIGAIKVVLLAHSEPLRNMLESSELAEKGDVRVVDVEPGTFKTFLKCIYGGSDVVIPKLSFQESVNLLYVIEKYMVTALKPKVVSHTLQLLPLTFDNIFYALSNPVCFSDEKLEKAIVTMLEFDVDKVFSSERFLLLSAEALLAIVKSDYLSTSETSVWDAVLKWAKHNTKSNSGSALRKTIQSHLKFIRFCTFSSKEFCEKVIPTGILTYSEVIAVSKYFSSCNTPMMKYICKSTNLRSRTNINQTLFFFAVNNIEPLTGRRKSQNFTWNNYSWYILLTKNENFFGFYLCCGGNSKNSSWKIPVTVEMVLINRKGKLNLSRTFRKILCKDVMGQGYSSFCFWSDLINVSNGFVKNNTIIVMVDVKEELE